MCGGRHERLEQEGCDEPADEAVEEAGLGQREAEPLIALDVLTELRLTGLGLDLKVAGAISFFQSSKGRHRSATAFRLSCVAFPRQVS